MDWKEILTQVTISLLGIVITVVSGYVIALINSNLTADAKAFITKNGKDIAEWIKEQIEIAIKKSKDKNKGK